MATSQQIQSFESNYSTAAQAVGAATGIDWRVILAQWGLESGYGTSAVAQSGNLGGLETTALTNSGISATGGTFAQFPSLQSFVTADSQYLNTPLYASVRKAADSGASASQQASLIANAGYDNGSPTPSYATGIMGVFNTLFSSSQNPSQTTQAQGVANAATSGLSKTLSATSGIGGGINAALNPSGGLLNLNGVIQSTSLKVVLTIGGIAVLIFGLWLLFRQPVENITSKMITKI